MKRNEEQFLAESIRSQYVEKESTELDTLRALDAKVKRPANIFAYLFGSISAIIMGTGMSLVMTDIGEMLNIENAMIPGIIIGALGLAMSLVTYPIYKKILDGRKKKYADEILRISDAIIKED